MIRCRLIRYNQYDFEMIKLQFHFQGYDLDSVLSIKRFQFGSLAHCNLTTLLVQKVYPDRFRHIRQNNTQILSEYYLGINQLRKPILSSYDNT